MEFFEGRKCRITITAERLSMLDRPLEDVADDIDSSLDDFENTFNAVATCTTQSSGFEMEEIEVIAILGRGADEASVRDELHQIINSEIILQS